MYPELGEIGENHECEGQQDKPEIVSEIVLPNLADIAIYYPPDCDNDERK